jgi:hypothetical protein
MIGAQYIKSNSERGIYILLLASNAGGEYEFKTVQNLFFEE